MVDRLGILRRVLCFDEEKEEEGEYAVSSEANTRRIQAVEEKFSTSGQPLQVPGRVLVGEGVLVKMCRKKPKPRQFYLFNDILVYGSIIISKKRFNKQHVVPLEDIHLQDIEDDGVLCNGWLIKSRSKSFAVYAATPLEKKEWMVHISRCIQDLLAKSGKKPGEDYAAVWVPDADARFCMQCKESRFSLVNRRHHCRNCGAVVCGVCSAKKWKLPAISRQSVRVCNHCYQQLSTNPAAAPINDLDATDGPSGNRSSSKDGGGEQSDEWSSEDSDEEGSSAVPPAAPAPDDQASAFYAPTSPPPTN